MVFWHKEQLSCFLFPHDLFARLSGDVLFVSLMFIEQTHTLLIHFICMKITGRSPRCGCEAQTNRCSALFSETRCFTLTKQPFCEPASSLFPPPVPMRKFLLLLFCSSCKHELPLLTERKGCMKCLHSVCHCWLLASGPEHSAEGNGSHVFQ